MSSPEKRRVAIIGGGAAGFFSAITAAEADPDSQVTIYERGKQLLSKVKISGGGRCNVTHSCFDPAELSKRYPRGSRELRGAFHRFQPQDTIAWFAQRGVTLKTEADGRMFPDTDSSQTIIDCFLKAARTAGVIVRTGTGLNDLTRLEEDTFQLTLSDETTAIADKVCITSGSLKASPITRSIESLGHTIEPLVPSLFSFNIKDSRIEGLAGLSVQNASVKTIPKSPAQVGPVLITHRGLSGPAILRLSAWEARKFEQNSYHLEISINWLGNTSQNQLRDQFASQRSASGKSLVKTRTPEGIPRRLWESLLQAAEIPPDTQWSQLPKDRETGLVNQLTDSRFKVQGKTTNKDEFVTCGGVKLKEIDFRTMESKKVPGLYFAGECLDIDGITGGFNFQAAWTGGHIAGLAMTSD
ncbi:NAD(P)/FAD-dependent oxidoreductase [Luteolibacter sp. AS25]|uniref:NAD(P)/FAD-dependent oxidoreductase n=1 Tax=Luteolibacter sp. AS25 TaxID=3135776 RepID=UPI00398B16CB